MCCRDFRRRALSGARFPANISVWHLAHCFRLFCNPGLEKSELMNKAPYTSASGGVRHSCSGCKGPCRYRPSRDTSRLRRRGGSRLPQSSPALVFGYRYEKAYGCACGQLTDGFVSTPCAPTGSKTWVLQARDDNVLEIVCKGMGELAFTQWTEPVLGNNSKLPLRLPKPFETHVRAVKHLLMAFGNRKLTDLTSDAIEGDCAIGGANVRGGRPGRASSTRDG